jgi:polysaccharide biosynthesis/export protein
VLSRIHGSVAVLSILFTVFCPSSFAQKDYLLGPEDIIEIIVWGHDDLKRQIPISLQGTITFPMIGEVKASGLSTQELEKEMAARLGDGYIIKPQITVTVKEFRSQKAYVMGQVEKPGIYPITQENTLLYFLSQAGPSTDRERAPGDEVVIIRPKNHVNRGLTLEEADARKAEIIRVNLREALAGDPAHNIMIQNGDSIVLPRQQFFFILGEIKNPGRYSLERGTNLLNALSIGGGPTKDADEEIEIIRPKVPSEKAITHQEAAVKNEKIIRIKLKEVLSGNPQDNIPIQHGDSIVLTLMPTFFVTGEVTKPGMYRLEKGTNVLKAISLAGGLTAKASSRSIKIVREKDKKKTEVKATYETLVQPEDTVVVPESFF